VRGNDKDRDSDADFVGPTPLCAVSRLLVGPGSRSWDIAGAEVCVAVHVLFRFLGRRSIL